VTPNSAAAIDRTRGRRVLVVSRHISDSVAEVFRTRDVHYVDAVGNMYVRWPGLVVDIRGRRAPTATRPTRIGKPLRAFKSSGLRVLFVLLSEPDSVDRPYREIGRLSGASLGTVQWVLKELEQIGHVRSTPTGRRLARTGDLFNRWVEAYTLDLWPRLALGDFDAADVTWWTAADDVIAPYQALWGGETAAYHLSGHLRPGKAVIYAPGLPEKLILDYRLRKAGPDGNVEIRNRFWNSPTPASQSTVPTPLVYADLVASGDPRQLAAARDLREHDELLRRLSNA
jgi:hypothetical protein